LEKNRNTPLGGKLDGGRKKGGRERHKRRGGNNSKKERMGLAEATEQLKSTEAKNVKGQLQEQAASRHTAKQGWTKEEASSKDVHKKKEWQTGC